MSTSKLEGSPLTSTPLARDAAVVVYVLVSLAATGLALLNAVKLAIVRLPPGRFYFSASILIIASLVNLAAQIGMSAVSLPHLRRGPLERKGLWAIGLALFGVLVFPVYYVLFMRT